MTLVVDRVYPWTRVVNRKNQKLIASMTNGNSITFFNEAILIRMMQMLLGKDVFQNGIRNYLKTYSYKNAETSDLWKALTNSSLEAGVLEKSLTIDSIMSSWALQSGFPVVHVVRNYTENSAVITQKRYFTLKPQHKSDKKKSDSCWMIPLTYTTSTELNFKEIKVKKWLYCDQLQIDNIAFKNDWIIFNINFQGIKGF
ncbi:aminopeptidase N-like isoform X2 [Lycorma delicatula]|uniref:aminopeptidase N-like isoform X2 n=1 Tax=Lycorma delicatula TaxID=130591 RepID=UPI003F517D04